MEFKKLMSAAALIGAMSFGASTASADTGAAAAFDAHYVNNSTCVSCHLGTPGTLTNLGLDWKAAGGTKKAGPGAAGWATLDATYADSFGGVDTTAATTTTPTTTTTSSDSGGGGCVASSATTPLMMVLAMLTLGFFVRRKKS